MRHEVLACGDTDLISKAPPLLLRRLDIGRLRVGIAFIARLSGGALHSALSHAHCDLRARQRDTVGRIQGGKGREVEKGTTRKGTLEEGGGRSGGWGGDTRKCTKDKRKEQKKNEKTNIRTSALILI